MVTASPSADSLLAVTSTGGADRSEFVPKRLTVDDVRAMLASGLLPDDNSVELIDGLLVVRDRGLGDVPMASPQHSYCIRKLRRVLEAQLPDDRYQVHAESDLDVSPVNLPQPDLSVVRGGPDDFATTFPTVADIPLLIEVSITSLGKDRGAKLRLYAAAAVTCYAILDATNREMTVHSDPVPETSSFATSTTFGGRESCRLPVDEQAPVEFELDEVLPPVES